MSEDDFEECWQLLDRCTPPSLAERMAKEVEGHMALHALRQIVAAGAVAYVENGWLKVRSKDGTITNVAPV